MPPHPHTHLDLMFAARHHPRPPVSRPGKIRTGFLVRASPLFGLCACEVNDVGGGASVRPLPAERYGAMLGSGVGGVGEIPRRNRMGRAVWWPPPPRTYLYYYARTTATAARRTGALARQQCRQSLGARVRRIRRAVVVASLPVASAAGEGWKLHRLPHRLFSGGGDTRRQRRFCAGTPPSSPAWLAVIAADRCFSSLPVVCQTPVWSVVQSFDV